MTTVPSDDRLPWQAEAWRHMARALANDRVAHGLLIAGPRGVGKRRFAERTARALVCRTHDAQGDACGSCSRCRQWMAGTHPDVSRLLPEERGKAIKIEQVRRFAHSLQLTPQYDTGRIGWIDPAEALTPSAANSLLKTLEEPPAGSHILLLTDRLSALLPTIRSRSQIWRLPAATPEAAREWLGEQQVDVDAVAADRLRAPLALVAALENHEADAIEQWDRDLARLLARRANPISVAERAAGAERGPWLDWLFRRSSDLLAACLLEDATTTGLDDATILAARGMGAGTLEGWSREVARVVRRAETNADWQLTLEALFIDLGQRVAAAGTGHTA